MDSSDIQKQVEDLLNAHTDIEVDIDELDELDNLLLKNTNKAVSIDVGDCIASTSIKSEEPIIASDSKACAPCVDVQVDSIIEVKEPTTQESTPTLIPTSNQESTPTSNQESKETVPTSTDNHDMPNDRLNEWLVRHKKIPLFDKIAGLVYGCALGDCLGLPLEGRSLEHVKSGSVQYITGMPTKDHRGIKQGDWTDDTDQLILLMDVFAENNLRFHPGKFAEKLLNWKKTGFKELGDVAGMGCGALTGRVVTKDNYVKNPIAAALSAYKEMGSNVAPNGAVMRCGIAAICENWQRVALQQSLVTHVDNRCTYSSWLVTAMCRFLMKGKAPTNEQLFKNKPAFIKKPHAEEFNKYQKIYDGDTEKMLEKLDLDREEEMGFTLKALGAAFYALSCIREGKVNTHDDYIHIQLEIVNRCGDADTNAAITGQVLGAHLGYSRLPKAWIKQLINKDWLDQKILKLFKAIAEH
jgi:ADP-ribosylglycohydrolase